MLLGTETAVGGVKTAVEFQSPERIHAFGNWADALNGGHAWSFNPQRGFMLLGTGGA